MKTPIQSWDKSKSSEVMDYILENVLPAISNLSENKVDAKELMDLKKALNLLILHVEDCKQKDLLQAINLCSTKIDGLTNAIKAVGTKLDGSEVVGLPNDFVSTINSNVTN